MDQYFARETALKMAREDRPHVGVAVDEAARIAAILARADVYFAFLIGDQPASAGS